MTKVYQINGITPVVDPSAFVHPDAVLIGDCIIGPHCYIGPCACLRGDFGRIVIAEGASVQDTCVIHTFPQRDTIIEKKVHVGHGAVLHGCTIKSNALIGMNCVIMDGVIVGKNSFVAAMSFLKSGFKVPDNSLVAGVPGKIIRELTQEEILWKSKGTSLYQQLVIRSLKTMKRVEPLVKVENNRQRCKFFNQIKPLHEMD